MNITEFLVDLKNWSEKQQHYNEINLSTKSQFDLLFSVHNKYSPFHCSLFCY